MGASDVVLGWNFGHSGKSPQAEGLMTQRRHAALLGEGRLDDEVGHEVGPLLDCPLCGTVRACT